MRLDDVDIEFHGTAAAPSTGERREWRRIVATALASRPGTAVVIFRSRGDKWSLETLLWHRPGVPFLKAAGRDETAPLRTAVVTALRAAGKDLQA